MFAEPLLFQQALDVRAFRSVGGTLQRPLKLLAPLVWNAETQVQLAERTAWFEGVWLKRHRPIQLLQSAIDLIGPGIGYAEHSSYRSTLRPHLEGLLQQANRFFQPTALERALSMFERLLGITEERGSWAAGHTFTHITV